jgi:trk system potassium uptake protein
MRDWKPRARPRQLSRIRHGIIELSPPQVLALVFAVLAILGAALLMTPWATYRPIPWIDALFTATSAVTVTGLVVVDTGTTYTLFGQLVLLTLIQLGGLGFMTFAVLIFQLLSGRLGLRQQIVLREALNQTSLGDLMRLVRILLLISLSMEGIALLVLSTQFVPEYGTWDGLYYSLFYAISAFNSAGFALHPDSLSSYVGNPVINLTITILFITGGLGFAVLADLYQNYHEGHHQKRRFRTLSLHTKLMLVGTLWLNLLAMLVILSLEWSNPATLGGLGHWADKLWAGWFQAVTPRSAGFNTVDTGELLPATAAFMIGLMFIGGGSASTAGGIKLTTFLILLLAVKAFLRQQEEPVAFGRAISQETVLKALAIIVITLMGVSTVTFLLAITEDHPFIDLLFEAMSGFATVGLSRGITPELTNFGKAVIILSMFVGRLGPLTLAFILAARPTARVKYTRGDVYIG